MDIWRFHAVSGLSVADHYRTNIAVYLRWYREREWPQGIPDEQDGDTGGRDIPSWWRICKVILRNDYWCRELSFARLDPTTTGTIWRG